MNTVTRTRSPQLDPACAAAVDLALAAAEDVAGIGKVGDHLGAHADADRVVTHRFACLEPAYRGWTWAVTVARASRSKLVTVDETVLLPGSEAILAPEWVPWSARLRPGDLGVGDLLPTAEDDERLVPGYTGADSVPAAVTATEAVAPEPAEDGTPGRPAVVFTKDGDGDSYGQLPLIVFDLGLDRPRVLSREGRQDAAERWYAGPNGPDNAITRHAPARCVTCGFLAPMSGPWAQAFGVCANEFSPSDGQVVALDHGCGAHSESPFTPPPVAPVLPIVDEFLVEPIAWEPIEDTEPGPGGEPEPGTEPEPGGEAASGAAEGAGQAGAAPAAEPGPPEDAGHS